MSNTAGSTGASPLELAYRAVRSPVVVVGVISVFINVLAFVAPVFMLQVYDRVLPSRNETTLLMLIGVAVFLHLAHGAIERFRHQILVHASVMFDRKVNGPAFDAALQAGLQTRGGHHAQVLRDVDTVRDFIGGTALLTLLDAPWVPVYLMVCFTFHPLIGWTATVGALVLFALAWINDRLTANLLVRASKLNMASLAGLSAVLRNAEAIRGMGMARAFRDRWQTKRNEAMVGQVHANERGGGVLAVSKIVRMSLQVAILGVSAWLVLEDQVSGGVMFAASMIMGKALAPLEQAVAQWKSFVGARSANSRLRDTFRVFPAQESRLQLPAPKGEISVEGLVVAVPGTNNVLVRGVSFSLKAGEALAVVGATGSGKSTLARALVGAWPAAAGAVRVDGNDIRHWDAEQIGAAMGYLPQDVELFEGTVAENIARFGAVEDARVVGAAQAAYAHGIIQKLPNGYATQLGEDGVGLSGGQRQRVGLARALYGSPAVVVLDEPNASLDGDGDEALVRAIDAIRKSGRTVVVISHRNNILSVVDKVLVMHEGVARQFGTREEMLPLLFGQPNRPQTAAAA